MVGALIACHNYLKHRPPTYSSSRQEKPACSRCLACVIVVMSIWWSSARTLIHVSVTQLSSFIPLTAQRRFTCATRNREEEKDGSTLFKNNAFFNGTLQTNLQICLILAPSWQQPKDRSFPIPHPLFRGRGAGGWVGRGLK